MSLSNQQITSNATHSTLWIVKATIIGTQQPSHHQTPELWDGRAAVRIGEIIENWWVRTRVDTSN